MTLQHASAPVAPVSAERELRLTAGRHLAYCEYGARDGAPVFFFHGWRGSRLDFAADDAAAVGAAAVGAGVHVIAGRPGIGGSDPQSRRTVLDWPADVAALAPTLLLCRGSWSWGSPSAARTRGRAPTRCHAG